MKRLIPFLVIPVFLFSCSEETTQPAEKSNEPTVLSYESKLKPVMFEITSTGCPGCGGWGKPTFASIAEERSGDLVPLAIHIKYGDPFITPWSQDIADNRYGDRYTPQIWVNDSNGVVLVPQGIDGTASVNRINELITEGLNDDLPLFGGKITGSTLSSISFKIGIKSDKILEGEYFLACYLLRSDLVHDQSNYSANPATHDYVIRKAASGGTWGKRVELNSEGTFEYSEEFSSIKRSDAHSIIAILWKKEGNRYKAIGGYSL